jgi:hypothetical protein
MRVNKIWQQIHRPSLERSRLKRRQTTIRYHDKPWLYGQKRDYPTDGHCELCGRETKHLGYHHYFDYDISEGIWLCMSCHNFAELADRGFFPIYLKLKERVTNVNYEVTYKDHSYVFTILPKFWPLKAEKQRIIKQVKEAI